MRLDRLITPAELSDFCTLPGAPRLDPTAPAMRQADAHWLARDDAGQPAARASLWWTHAPPHPAQRIGCIGHFAAQDRAPAAVLLDRVCAELAAAGCTLAVGPLDGNTFRAYRFVTRRAFDGPAYPPFFLEPDNPDAWPADFSAAGFAPWAEYYSSLTTLDTPDPRLAEAMRHLAEHRISVRSPAPGAFERELARLYEMILVSFSRALLFAPIARAEFMAQYAALQPVLIPDLALLAEQEGRLVGFLLALPDLAQAQRGAPVDTVILKTLAVLPELGGGGIGSALVAVGQEQARQMGFRQAIHALMHDANLSRKISAHYARPIRQYTLFAKTVGSGQ